MGLIGKIAALRVLGGDANGGGGSNPLVLIMIVIVAFMLVAMAISWIVQQITNAIYSVIRPVLMIAPNFTTVIVGGVLVLLLGRIVEPYSKESAVNLLSSSEGPRPYYVGVGISLFIFTGVGSTFVLAMDHITIHLNAILGLISIYGLYKFIQALWRTHRLVLRMPQGTLYSIALFTPLTTAIVISIFNVPTVYKFLSPPIWLVPTLLVASLAIVRYRVEHQILHPSENKTAATPAPE